MVEQRDGGNRSAAGRPLLRLVPGGRERSKILLEELALELRRPGSELGDVDAIVIEDDTYFVLGADPGFTEPVGHPLRLWNELHAAEPAPLGTVHPRGGRPLRLHAVIHELSEDPTWKPQSVFAALDGVLDQVGGRGLGSLALPVLGAVHGKLTADRFVDLLRGALGRHRPPCLRRLVLLAEGEIADRVQQLLAE
jgi:hypothetical protein